MQIMRIGTMTKQEREICVMCSISVAEGKKVVCSEGIQVKDCPIQKGKKNEEVRTQR